MDNLVEYDVRLIESSSEDSHRKVRTQLPGRPFYVLQEGDKRDATTSTLVQVYTCRYSLNLNACYP